MTIIEGNDAIKFLKQFEEINKRLEENPELREIAREKAFKIKFNAESLEVGDGGGWNNTNSNIKY